MDAKHKLADRLAQVEERIAAACQRAGRARSSVTMVAVTKTVSADVAGLLPSLGVVDLGESRPQELERKASTVAGPVRWHLIGHLQRNKVETAAPIAQLIHSVDSLRLLDAVDAWATRAGRTVPVLLEVNASGEQAKHGFEPAEMDDVVATLAKRQAVVVRGLMTMAALQDAEACRPTFRGLRDLAHRLATKTPAPHAMTELSMGMTNDFEVAIEEGATFVRLGSVLFEGL